MDGSAHVCSSVYLNEDEEAQRLGHAKVPCAQPRASIHTLKDDPLLPVARVASAASAPAPAPFSRMVRESSMASKTW